MDPRHNEKMIQAKLKLLERFRKEKAQRLKSRAASRLPPGQHLVSSFPVLDLGVRPAFDPATWRLRVFGEVEAPRELSWEELLRLPKTEQVSDFHCVTTWSKFDVRWGGVRMKDLCAVVRPGPKAAHVVLHCGDGYTTNVPLHEASAEDSLLAYELDGKPLPLEHGAPLRMIIPTLYAWKSAKFLTGVEFREDDQPGYWEVRGYHNRADPWLEERFSSQEPPPGWQPPD